MNWFWQIKSLEAELRKQDGREKSLTNGEEAKHREPYIQLVKGKTLNLIFSSKCYHLLLCSTSSHLFTLLSKYFRMFF